MNEKYFTVTINLFPTSRWIKKNEIKWSCAKNLQPIQFSLKYRAVNDIHVHTYVFILVWIYTLCDIWHECMHYISTIITFIQCCLYLDFNNQDTQIHSWTICMLILCTCIITKVIKNNTGMYTEESSQHIYKTQTIQSVTDQCHSQWVLIIRVQHCNVTLTSLNHS